MKLESRLAEALGDDPVRTRRNLQPARVFLKLDTQGRRRLGNGAVRARPRPALGTTAGCVRK